LIFARVTQARKAKSYILVDSSDLNGIPSFIDPNNFIEIIDHRSFTKATEDFPNAIVEISQVGAAATLITEKFREQGITPSTATATLLYGAIHSNTLSLRGSITSSRDVEADAWLRETVVIPSNWLERQYGARKNEIMTDLDAALVRERKSYEHHTGAYAVSQLEYAGASDTVKRDVDKIRMKLSSLSPRTMANFVDVGSAVSYLICPDNELRSWVSGSLGIRFTGDLAEISPALLRKQIVSAISRD
jgi:nanoRNase/pAp phosphatase (c-di-AMP/oligoRNAs hydrolase)